MNKQQIEQAEATIVSVWGKCEGEYTVGNSYFPGGWLGEVGVDCYAAYHGSYGVGSGDDGQTWGVQHSSDGVPLEGDGYNGLSLADAAETVLILENAKRPTLR